MHKKERIIGYSIIRVIAIVLVVVGHCTSLSIGSDGNIINYYSNVENLNIPNYTEIFRQIIYSFHMPLFVFLSGATFGITFNRNKKLKEVVSKRCVRLIVPYILVAFLILIPIRLFVGYYGQDYNYFSIILKDVILGFDINYLWYVIMIFEVNIIMFLIFKYIKINTKLKKILFMILFLTLSVVQFSFGTLPFQIHRTLEFLIWFYLGYLFEENRKSILEKTKKLFIFFVLTSFLIFIGAFLINSEMIQRIDNTDSKMIIFIYKIIKMGLRYVLGLSAIAFITLIVFKVKKMNTIYKKIDRESFGIYLYHIPIYYIYVYLISNFIEPKYMNNILYFFLLIVGFGISLICSYGFSMLINKTTKSLNIIYKPNVLF